MLKRGHNGVKSMESNLKGNQMSHIRLGIGRPVSRESEKVAAYVLAKFTKNDKELIETDVLNKFEKIIESI